MALDFRNMKKLSIAGIELKELLINGYKIWSSVTNWIAKSINADGTPYRGANGEIGYKTDTRLISSNGVESASATTDVTGFIPCVPKDKFYISQGLMPGDNNARVAVVLYDSSFAFLAYSNVKGLVTNKNATQLINEGLSFYSDDTLHTVTPYCLRYYHGSSVVNKTAYVRFCTYPITAAACISKNEPL